MRTLLLAIVMCDGMCSLRLNTAMRTPFDTGYLYVRNHASSVIFFLSSPCFVSTSAVVRSGASGGGMALLIRLMPIRASSIYTIDNSPL